MAQPKNKPRQVKKTIRLSSDAESKLRRASERLGVTQGKIVEVLVDMHADELKVRFE